MSNSLSKISKELDEKFVEDWVNEFLVSTEILDTNEIGLIAEEIKSKKAKISKFFDEISNSVFINLSLFLLQGEYLDFAAAKRELSAIKDKINSFSTQIEWPDNESEEVREYYSKNKEVLFWDKFINPSKDFCSIVDQFLEKIDSYIKLRSHELLFNIDEVNDGDDRFFLDLKGSNTNEIILLKSIAKVSEIDHHLAYKKSSLITLITIHNKLTEDLLSFKTEPVYILLSEKTSFLIYKLVNNLELDKTKGRESISKQVYIIGNSFYELDKDNYKTTYLQNWENNLKSHYLEIREHKISGDDVTKLLEKCGRGDHSGLNLQKFHDAVKYSKDIEKSLPNLILIHRLFEKFSKSKMENQPTEFDSFSYKVARNYVANNMLSLAMERCETSENVESELLKVINIQSETGIKNFFPYYKAAKAISIIIEKELKNDGLRNVNFDRNIKRLENSINLFNSYIKSWELFIDWCKRVNYLSFRLSQDESSEKVIIEAKDYRLFMASSYILPFNYEAKKEELKEYRNKAIQYDSYISVLKTSKGQLDNVNNLMKSVNSQERKFIEILAIFAAIVLFTSGSIQVFNKERTFGDSLMFLGVFGVCLILFVILIKSIFSENKSGISEKTFFKDINFTASLTMASMIIIGSYCVYNNKEDMVNREKDEIIAINEKLPLRKPSFDPKWTTMLNKYEILFSLNGEKNSGKLPWFKFSPGSSKLLILAPHATSHIRNGSVKRAENGTGSLAVLLNEQFDIPVLYTTYQSPSDPNFYDDNAFKDTLSSIIQLYKPAFVIDLHGSEFSKPYDVDLGTLNNKSYLNKEALFLKLIKTLKSDGLNYISQDYFAAENNQTNTKWLFNKNIPCVQLEINSNYLIRSDSTFNNEMFLFKQKSSQILQALIDFKILVDEEVD